MLAPALEGAIPNSTAAVDQQPLPTPPVLSIEIPYATAEYSSTGVFITYCARVRDDTNDLEWQTTNRYSVFRKLHSSVGKHHTGGVGGVGFPSIILTAKGNRNKQSIEQRRVKLEQYMQSLLKNVFTPNPNKSIPFHHVAKILKFLEYPFVGDWDVLLRLSADPENESIPSQEATPTAAANAAISALDEHTPASTLATSRWRSPPVLPGPRLGLALPFAVLTQNIECEWEVLIKGDRTAKKGILRHRYDECAAMAYQLAKHNNLMDPAEAQDFILEFRRKHPIAAYMRFERALEIQTPTSLSSRRECATNNSSGGFTDSPHGNGSFGSSDEVITSPIVHSERKHAFPSGGAPTSPHPANSAAELREREAEEVSPLLYNSKRSLEWDGEDEYNTSMSQQQGYHAAHRHKKPPVCNHYALSDSYHLVPTSIINQDVYQTPTRRTPHRFPQQHHHHVDPGRVGGGGSGGGADSGVGATAGVAKPLFSNNSDDDDGAAVLNHKSEGNTSQPTALRVRSPPPSSSAAGTVGVDTIGIGSPATQQKLGHHSTAGSRKNLLARNNSGVCVSGQEKYLALVKGNRVTGCQCTKQTFCSTDGDGDMYETQSGFTLIVCPPLSQPED